MEQSKNSQETRGSSHSIIESLWLEKTSMMTKSNHQPIITPPIPLLVHPNFCSHSLDFQQQFLQRDSPSDPGTDSSSSALLFQTSPSAPPAQCSAPAWL